LSLATLLSQGTLFIKTFTGYFYERLAEIGIDRFHELWAKKHGRAESYTEELATIGGMDEESSFITAYLRKLEKYVRTLPNMQQLTSLDRQDRERLRALEDTLSEARRLANDAATTDTSSIKHASFQYCQEQLEAFRSALLLASHTNLVDVVDVAQLSAMADEVADLVKKRKAALQ
jgi:hypothetical protein